MERHLVFQEKNRPGIIFYNDEGTENGGLTFMGKTDSISGNILQPDIFF